MKTAAKNKPPYYTDPIVFESGFFKDQQEQQIFLDKVEAANRKARAAQAKKAKAA
jgi:hypothetical protein